MSRKRKYNIHISRAVIPSFFTILNMFSGFMSVLSSADKDYASAAWLIILAAIFDSLDGIMARLTRSSSEFGVELDSLSDLVSFGVAPSFMIYRIGLHTLGPLGTLSSAMLMVFGGLRLARFNVQLVGFDKDYFKGLPIPSSAIVISSFVLSFYDRTMGALDTDAIVLPAIAVSLSLLMVSTVRYDTIPKFSRRAVRSHPMKFSIFMISLLIIIATLGKALFWLFVLYIVGGLVRWVVEHIKALLSPPKREEEEEDVELSSFDI
ncbi:MAG TPA: CDP-diacylglycerol--serine O-phosphatidyltransferase [Candidatus Acidoferrales bacterium]|nr:CDP-diacylglycerol--serine O-phosphatidyltransferase [Candidatus Acidoferrales bacterium]